jgi:large subunit ribosomal protein L22
MSVEDALNALKYQPNRGARFLEKVLKSAAANAEDRGARGVERMTVADARADGGPMFKRIRPQSRGMAYTIRRRFAHIHVGIDVPEVA